MLRALEDHRRLFITAPVAVLPEVFATWYVARSGQVTSGVTSVIGDHVVTITLPVIPLTVVGMPIENIQLFWVTLAFVAVMPALYAGFIWGGGSGERVQAMAGPHAACGLCRLRGRDRLLGAALRT